MQKITSKLQKLISPEHLIKSDDALVILHKVESANLAD